jgi:hypothetical protein
VTVWTGSRPETFDRCSVPPSLTFAYPQIPSREPLDPVRTPPVAPVGGYEGALSGPPTHGDLLVQFRHGTVNDGGTGGSPVQRFEVVGDALMGFVHVSALLACFMRHSVSPFVVNVLGVREAPVTYLPLSLLPTCSPVLVKGLVDGLDGVLPTFIDDHRTPVWWYT